MPILRIWFATRFQRHHPIENNRSRQLVSYPWILLSMMQLPENTSKTLMFWAKALRRRLPNYSAAMSLKMNLQRTLFWIFFYPSSHIQPFVSWWRIFYSDSVLSNKNVTNKNTGESKILNVNGYSSKNESAFLSKRLKDVRGEFKCSTCNQGRILMGGVGKCTPPLRSFCNSPDNFSTSPEKSCTSP
jgi:hypothetical protein